MSDDLEIRSAGAVAVDTVTLRGAAAGFVALAEELDEIAHLVGSAAYRLVDVSPAGDGSAHALELVRRRILSASAAAGQIVGALRGAAAVYEVVELRVERAAAVAAGDVAGVARIDARLAALDREYPDAARLASGETFAHELRWPGGLAAQAPGLLWWLAPGFALTAIPLAWSLQRAIAVGGGTVPAATSLRGAPAAVTVSPVAPRAPATAPASLADAAARVPGDAAARVRVERYTMADGSRQFAVYVAGTQTVAGDPREPFDMNSNIQLYSGERSASYDATMVALADAGARPGDVVHAFGHSQGAMVATRLALEGEYDARTLVTFGSPVEGQVGDGTLSIALRHRDDPVAALAGGGHVASVGAPGSFVASRTADPLPGLHDVRMPAHGIDSYTATARMLDDSGDARMAGVREVWDRLGAAASVDVIEYSAERAVLPQPDPRPGPVPVSPRGEDAG